MATAYYGHKISDNKVTPPEGFLICKNVPIGRTGWQEYTADEIGVEGNGIVQVYRDPEEVFHPATIASFEGKPITDLHPSQWVNTNNHGAYARGHVQNVRRGTGEDSDFLLSDLHIKDEPLINKTENGHNEVSSGYNCDYVQIGEDKYAQKNIRGNHVAVVPNGRAGNQVAIRDHKPEMGKEKKTVKNILQHIMGLGLKAYAQDAEPEEVAKAMEATKKGDENTEKRNEDCSAKDAELNEHAAAMQQILESLNAIEGRLAKLESSESAEASGPEESLDAFVKELEEGKKEEKTGDAEVVPVETLSAEEIPKNPIPGADSAAAIAAIKAMRPVIAAMPEGTAKKQACDALIASLRPVASQEASYGAMLKLKKAQDAAKMDDTDFGKNAKEKFHRKNIVR